MTTAIATGPAFKRISGYDRTVHLEPRIDFDTGKLLSLTVTIGEGEKPHGEMHIMLSSDEARSLADQLNMAADAQDAVQKAMES